MSAARGPNVKVRVLARAQDSDKEKLRSSLGQAIMVERPNVKVWRGMPLGKSSVCARRLPEDGVRRQAPHRVWHTYQSAPGAPLRMESDVKPGTMFVFGVEFSRCAHHEPHEKHERAN